MPYRVRSAENANALVPLLFMFHGRGANEGDIFELVEYVNREVMVVAPRAPELFSDDPRGSFQWFARPTPEATLTDFEKPLNLVLQLLEKLADEYPIDRKRIFFGGFSQGAALSHIAAILHPEVVTGVIAHSGFLPPSPALRANLFNTKGKPYFIAHGTGDELVGIGRAQEARTLLEAAGAVVTYKEYPIGHATSPASRRDLAEWLQVHL
jgi:phospholipase/carboxylesterase